MGKQKYKVVNVSAKDRFLKFVAFALIIFSTVAIILYFWKFNGDLSDNQNDWAAFGTYISAFFGTLAIVGIIATYLQSLASIKKTNSLPVCTDIFKELRDQKLRKAMDNIRKKLPAYFNEPISIDQLKEKDKKLACEIRQYCYFMNNIGALVVHDLIDDDLIISYFGTEVVQMYDLLNPFIQAQREADFKKFKESKDLTYLKNDKDLLADAVKLTYAHFEILANISREEGPKMVKKFEKMTATKLDKSNYYYRNKIKSWFKTTIYFFKRITIEKSKFNGN